ncbi:DUF3858 domain-containing protein [uncultured Winogradskyella sp.]|uniref:DUF3858 domain-containing protein n=1 Tax=uncultured Winogradskyella sp. TaxID=395353 RepID=UPI003513BFCD
MNFKLLLLFLIFSTLSFSQEFHEGFDVYDRELRIHQFPQDTTAGAIVIYSYGNAFIDKNSFLLRFQVQKKIKVLKKNALNTGEVEVKLYKNGANKEKINRITGASYNLENDNRVKSELSPDAIYETEHENYTSVRFVIPNVKVGSVITYSYETESPFIRKFQPWYFQGENPVIYSEYNTNIPGNYTYHIKLVGSLPLEVNESNIERSCIELARGASADCMVSKFVMKNIPAFRIEGYMTTPLNYLSRIEYELKEIRNFSGEKEKLTKSWKNVDSELKSSTYFGKQLKKTNLVKNLLPDDILENESEIERAKKIYHYVIDTYKWNGKIAPYEVSIKDLLDKKTGNAHEINLLLYNLFKDQNFEVYPVLLSTRDSGFVTKLFPVLTEFNYVILKLLINGKSYFIDGTNPYQSFGEIPFRCLNQYGRLIDFKNESKWEDIKINKYSSVLHLVNGTIENGSLVGKIQSRYSGYHALKPKQDYDENSGAYFNAFNNTYPEIEFTDQKALDYDKTSFVFKQEQLFEMELEIIGNNIYLNPFLVRFFESNPFKLQQRTYPIDFGYKDIYSYSFKLAIPEGYSIMEVPENQNLELPNKTGTFNYSVSKQENEVSINFKLNFNLSLYPPNYYESLKILMSKVLDNQNNNVIVLKKN